MDLVKILGGSMQIGDLVKYTKRYDRNGTDIALLMIIECHINGNIKCHCIYSGKQGWFNGKDLEVVNGNTI